MSAAPRLTLQYMLIYAGTGASLPFAAVWLKAQGLDGAQIGVVLATPLMARLITGPTTAIWADGLRRRRSGIALMGLLAVLGYGAAAVVDGFALMALAWFIGATAAAALPPLVDVLNMRMARRDGYAFSRPRGYGSAAFVVANLVVGWLLVRGTADVVILWVMAAYALAALAAWRVLPQEPTESDGPGMARLRGLRDLFANRPLMIVLFAVGLTQATHAFYYGFSALVWTEQGISAATAGVLWGFSVVIEIGVMWWAMPWLHQRGVGAVGLLGAGAAAAILRWAVMAFDPPLWTLWPLQALHGLTFAATYMAGLELVERLSPPKSHTVAQTLSSALSSGVLIGLATIISGPLYDRFGSGGYWAMAAIAGAGGLLALAAPRGPDVAVSARISGAGGASE